MTKQTFKLRKLRTGKLVTAVAGIILAGTMMASKADAAVAGYDTVATPDASTWEARTVEQVKVEIGDFSKPYTIKWGDTLGVIAEATGIDVNKIAQDNGIADVNLIFTGNVLYSKDGYTAVGNVETGEVTVYQEVAKTPAANTQEAVKQVEGQKVQQNVTNSQDQKVQEIKQEVQQHLDHGRETQVQPQEQGQPSSTVVGVEEKPATPVAPAEKPAQTTTTNGEKPADTVKPTEEQPTTQVVTPAIRKESVKTVTPIKHGVIERTDATLPKGERKVIQNGRDGSITIVTTTVYEDGIVKSSTQVSKEVVDAIDEIVLVGTKEAQPVVPTERPADTTEAPKPVAPVETPEKPSTTTETPQQEKPVVTPEQPTTTTEAPKPVAPVEVKTNETRKVRELAVETETINDATIPAGKEVVDNAGSAGYVEQDFEITTVNGVKTGEKAIGTERTVAGTKRVVRKGTGTAAPYARDARANENTKKYATLEALNNASDAELSAIKKGDLDFKSTSKTKNLEEAKQIAKYGNEHLDVLKVNDEFAKLMNAERAKKGVAPLTVDRELVRLAGIRSAELANQKDGASIYVNGKAHVRTDGSSFSTIYKEYQGERPAFKGENSLGNIEVVTDAKNFLNETQVAKMMYEQWAASPGHYANMMSDNFQTFGVDIEYGATSQGYGNYSGMSGVGTTLFGGSIK